MNKKPAYTSSLCAKFFLNFALFFGKTSNRISLLILWGDFNRSLMRLHLRLYQLRYLAVEAVDRGGLRFIHTSPCTVDELLEGSKVFVQRSVETA